MKKLITAVAMACAVAYLNAGTVNWSVKNVYDEAGENKITAANGYSMYLFTTEVASIDSWAGLKTAADLSGQISKGQNIAFTAAGNSVPTDPVAHTTLTQLGLKTETPYEFYVVAFNGSDAYYMTPSLTDQTISPLADDLTSLSFGSQTSYTQKGSEAYVGWTTVGSVPEPTSGLLLLLGVAGLALRRHRA